MRPVFSRWSGILAIQTWTVAGPVQDGPVCITTNMICECFHSFQQLWQDEKLRWSPEDNGEITTIRVPIEKIWRPDITLYNVAEVNGQEYKDSHTVIYNSGDVLHIPSATLKSTCMVDLTYFPYDTQECALKFGSWVYNGNQISLDFYEGKTMDIY